MMSGGFFRYDVWHFCGEDILFDDHCSPKGAIGVGAETRSVEW